MDTNHLSTRYEGGLKCVLKLTSTVFLTCASQRSQSGRSVDWIKKLNMVPLFKLDMHSKWNTLKKWNISHKNSDFWSFLKLSEILAAQGQPSKWSQSVELRSCYDSSGNLHAILIYLRAWGTFMFLIPHLKTVFLLSEKVDIYNTHSDCCSSISNNPQRLKDLCLIDYSIFIR